MQKLSVVLYNIPWRGAQCVPPAWIFFSLDTDRERHTLDDEEKKYPGGPRAQNEMKFQMKFPQASSMEILHTRYYRWTARWFNSFELFGERFYGPVGRPSQGSKFIKHVERMLFKYKCGQDQVWGYCGSKTFKVMLLFLKMSWEDKTLVLKKKWFKTPRRDFKILILKGLNGLKLMRKQIWKWSNFITSYSTFNLAIQCICQD